MDIPIGKYTIGIPKLTSLDYLFMGVLLFHIIMLIKAAFRRQWGWFFAMIAFPILDIIYVFK